MFLFIDKASLQHSSCTAANTYHIDCMSTRYLLYCIKALTNAFW